MRGWLRKWRGSAWAWLVQRELRAFSRRSDFKKVKPDQVLRALLQLAQLQEEGYSSWSIRVLRPILFRIWELAEERTKQQDGLAFKWNRVMATCNTLYGLEESYSKSQGGFAADAVGF